MNKESPRVLTRHEIDVLYDKNKGGLGTVVVIEDMKTHDLHMAIIDKASGETFAVWGSVQDNVRSMHEYGVTWRCWTSAPSAEEMASYKDPIDTVKVLCPYCGEVMKLCIHGRSEEWADVFRYTCEKCGTSSPSMPTEHEALDKAYNRYSKQAYVLSVDEAYQADGCWIEYRMTGIMEPCGLYHETDVCGGDGFQVAIVGEETADDWEFVRKSDYGTNYRCWSSKPTVNDLKNNPWE